ncbi:hypothetical protein [Rhodohalobacter sp. 8-1]|uniref:hypothetical protein n=1 Tax=Rhodohalobacter sp. 8-1 TaxID=3131972 RepID=UPI0030EBE877
MFKLNSTKLLTIVILLLTLISYSIGGESNEQFDWTGRWEIPDMENASTDFFIVLNNNSGQIEGQHCFISSYADECASPDIVSLNNFDVIDSNTIELDFISQYSMGSLSETTGRVRLTVINPDRIKWEVIEMPASKRPPTPIPAEKELVRVN